MNQYKLYVDMKEGSHDYVSASVYNMFDEKVLDLKLERDMWKEEHEKVRQKYIDKDVELQIVDKIVLQYEKRINYLEEK